MTDEQTLAEIRKRDKNYCRSPGVAPYAPDDRRTLLRLLDEARAERDKARSALVREGLDPCATERLTADLAAVRAERDAAYEALKWVLTHNNVNWWKAPPPAVAAVLEKIRSPGTLPACIKETK